MTFERNLKLFIMKKLLLFVAITFITTKSIAQAVAEYNFNNSNYADVNGNNPFASGTSIGFTTDRHGNANGALALNSVPSPKGGDGLANGTNATIPNLPIGNQARTISFWISCNNTLSNNYYFSYGSATTNASCGLGQFTTTTSSGGVKPTITTKNDLNFFGYGNDLIHTPYKTNPTSWTHFVVTYSDADVATIYVNGTLTATATKAVWNTTNSVFRLGQTIQGVNSIIAYYDDLKIYSRALTATEISNLHSYNSLSSKDFIRQNLKASIYPNPTSNNFTIEMETEVQKVEINSILGQKILTSNSKNINVSGLPKGIYMVLIEDTNNAITTQKLIVE